MFKNYFTNIILTLLQILVILLFAKLLSGMFSYSHQFDKLNPINNIIEFSLNVDILSIYDDNIDDNNSSDKTERDELITAIFTAVIISHKTYLKDQTYKKIQSPPP